MMIAAAMFAAALSVRILAPAADSFVSGSTVLRAHVEPADAAAIVSFFVDGRPVCRVARPPYECDWDAGRTIVEHRIRVVAASADSPETRTVATISTKGIAVAESVDVDLVEVTVTVTDGGSKYVMGLPQRAAGPTNILQEIPPLDPDQFPSVPIPPYQNGIIVLESLPGPYPVIYLDFQGGYTPTWGGISYERPAFTNAQIREIWKRAR
jgi:hypothetical protein